MAKAKIYTELKTGEKYASRTEMKKHEASESIQERIKEYGKNDARNRTSMVSSLIGKKKKK